MLKDEVPIRFDLKGLNIEVCAVDDRKRTERLEIWPGVIYRPSKGCFERIFGLDADSISVGSPEVR
jgi:hypothetical protein